MPRKRRILFEGGIYHVTQRGAARAPIFLDDADRLRFLQRLGDAIEEDGVRLYMYCLMPNHFHLLVETPRANLSAFMHRFQTAYTLYFNVRHRRTGHLMQGRFHAAPVQGDRYMLKLTRYIHLNPVASGENSQIPLSQRIQRLREYVWSSYRGYAGIATPEEFVDERPLLAMMHGKTIARRRVEYSRFVEAGLARVDAEWIDIYRRGQQGIDADVILTNSHEKSEGARETASRTQSATLRSRCPCIDPEAIIMKVGMEFAISKDKLRMRTYAGLARSTALLMLTRHARMTQRKAADVMGLGTAAAVCQQISRLKKRLATDSGLATRISKLSAAIERSLA